MKIIVIGASRGSGALAVKEALARGHEVTAFARSPDKLVLEDPKLRRARGDFHDQRSVTDAVAGHDAVILTAMASVLKVFKDNPRYLSQGTENTIAAMQACGCKRLVVLSALGVGDSRKLMPAPIRWIAVDWLLRRPYADHERQEQLVRASGLDWVIARPSQLTDGPTQHRYMKTREISAVPLKISRGDLAHFLVDACTGDEWVGAAVQLGG